MKFSRKRPSSSILILGISLIVILMFGTGAQTQSTVTVRLFDSSSNPLTGGSLRYYDGSWNTAVNNGDGTFTVTTYASSVSYEMTYAGAAQTKSNLSSTTSPVDFQTLNVQVQLKNSAGAFLDQGAVQYYAGTWMNFGSTSGGMAAKELLPYNYKFRMTYASASQEKYQNVGNDPVVVFQTVNVAVQLQNSTGSLMDQGAVQYYAGTWLDFGTTSNGQITKELLPYNYKFRMTYAYASNEKYQDVGTNPTVIFQTRNVTVQLQSSTTALIDTGAVQYYSGAWYNFGTTTGGQVTKELLPYNYKFRMTYAYASNEKYQDVTSNPTVVFQTKNVAVTLQSSTSLPLDTGKVMYYAGAWKDFGTTSGGQANKELLPYNYKFRMTYAFTSNEKYQEVGANPTVVFETVLTSVLLKDKNGSLIDRGTVLYYSGQWKPFGYTSGGLVEKQLLPYNYKFRMTFNSKSYEKYQNTGTDPVVIFQMDYVPVPPTLIVNEPSDGVSTENGTVTVAGRTDNSSVTIKVNGIAVSVASDGSFTTAVSLTEGPNTITIIAINSAGTKNTLIRTVTRSAGTLPPDPVTVAPPLEETVAFNIAEATGFLYTGPNPIQTEVDTAAMEPVRACVLRGKVCTADGEALSGVAVTVLNHPEFGKTLSRADGWFDMAVNGGGYLTVDYSKSGYLPAQRQVDAPWQDFAVLDSVALVQLDPQVTAVDFSDTIEVARGSVVTDQDGTRQATLLFSQGTQARMILANGDSVALDSIHVRATEYTVGLNGPASMPAELPPDVAYTYCVELSADEALAAGAENIQFDQPVTLYVDNFLGFPTGTPVPVGYYDRTQGKWVPSDNGRVIKIVSHENGAARIDANGDNLPESTEYLESIGITASEQRRLGGLYSGGQSLWMAELRHFSTVDLNYPAETDEDAENPDEDDPEKEKDPDDDCIEDGSIIGIQSQTLRERIGLTGTGMNLVYDSGKVPGRLPAIDISLSKSIIPASLKGIQLIVFVAGRRYEFSYPAQTNLSQRFVWDGKDMYGRTVEGQQRVEIHIGYVYDAYYQIPQDVSRTFGQPGALATSIPTRTAKTLWQEMETTIGTSVRHVAGWNLDLHHSYDPNKQAFFSGAGTRRSATNSGMVIHTVAGSDRFPDGISDYLCSAPDGSVYFADGNDRIFRMGADSIFTHIAGNGEYGFSGDNIPAANAQVDLPYGLTVGPDGCIYIADENNNRIRKISGDGTIMTVAGNGKAGFSGDGGPATQAQLNSPSDIVFGADGSYYIADQFNSRVRRVGLDGTISTIAGTGTMGYSGDGGPAISAALMTPVGLAAGADGSLYISDKFNNRIRKITYDGIISTIAGTGSGGSSGDNGPAINARLSGPSGIDLGFDGSLYIADYYNNKIRKVRPDGLIVTIAGTGGSGFTGDGVLATTAKLRYPSDVTVGRDGTVYFSDMKNSRIRRVDTIGYLYTVAGTSTTERGGFSGDGGLANTALLNWPKGLTIHSDGTLYFSDTGNSRVRKVSTTGIISTVAGNGQNGFSGDGGLATEAQLFWPHGMATGSDGSLYLADMRNNRIRKIGTDGRINTVAGNGMKGYGGDGGPALSAQLNWPVDVAYGKDGTLFITDQSNHRIRTVGEDGTIHTLAGTGVDSDNGDDGPAFAAQLSWPADVELDSEGRVYICDQGNNRIRRIGADGIIKAFAGTGDWGFSGDGGPAKEAWFDNPSQIAFDGTGNLYITEEFNYRVRKVGANRIITTVIGNGEYSTSDVNGVFAKAAAVSPTGIAITPNGTLYIADDRERVRKIEELFPSFTEGAISIVSEDGNEIYEFDQYGKHLKTVDALTGIELFKFDYDNSGCLVKVTDRDGLKTAIQRDASGNPTTVVSPFGQRTVFALDPNSYLKSVTNPANETVSFDYTEKGLMTGMTDARGGVYTFEYDSLGRLVKDTDPVGGMKTLSRNPVENGYEVIFTSAEGQRSVYRTQRLADGAMKMTNIDPSGLEVVSMSGKDGQLSIQYPNGTQINQKKSPDPRFGMQVPLMESMTVQTPSGLISMIRQGRKVNQLSGLEVTGIIDTVTVNGKSTITVYDAQSRTYSTTSPEGRLATSYVDEKGRVVQDSIPGIQSTYYTYNDQGFLTQARQGDRVSHFSYNDQGRLETVTDPLNRTATMDYDSVGRVVHQTLADGRVIDYSYDANGNLTTLTPPGKPAHAFSHTPVNMTRGYYPPLLPDSTGNTGYLYNLDRQIVQTLFSDSSLIQVVYDTTGCGCGGVGKPAQIIYDRGTAKFLYDNDNGNLTHIVSPTLDTLRYTYDGFLPERVTWKGSVNGSVGVSYNNDFQVTSQTVNAGNSVSFGYDNDGLLTSAGNMAVSRNTQNGLMTGTALGNVTTGYSYTSTGELSEYNAQYSGSDLFRTNYHYDKVGRIDTLWETALGIQKKFVYHYDLAGRLERVERNDTTLSVYHYDANGNRLSHVTQADSVIGVYDDQDRMLSYGNATFGYSVTGSLRWKAENGDTTWYDYDLMGNLVSVNMPDGTLVQYLIDGQNRRVGKVVNGKVIKRWLYQNQLNIVAELDSLGNVESRFVYGTRGHVPAYMVRDGVTYRFITDHLGSVRFVINVASGDVVQYISYDEFGNILTDTNPVFQPFGYAGGLYDVHTSFVRFGVRDYDCHMGRWTTKDPIKFNGGFNFYIYVFNNPIIFIDPLGLQLTATYSQTTGHMTLAYVFPAEPGNPWTHDIVTPISEADGYSGTGEGRDNPNMQNIHDKGPIPRGTYEMGIGYKSDKCGPMTIPLTPSEDTDTFGRTDFRIHGNDSENDASTGCIVMPPAVRQTINDYGGGTLTVIE